MIEVKKVRCKSYVLSNDFIICFGPSLNVFDEELNIVVEQDEEVYSARIVSDWVLFQNKPGKNIRRINMQTLAMDTLNVKGYIELSHLVNTTLFFWDCEEELSQLDLNFDAQKATINKFPVYIGKDFYLKLTKAEGQEII